MDTGELALLPAPPEYVNTVRHLLGHIAPRKAGGRDGLSSGVVRHLAPAVAEDVATIFFSLRTASVVPFDWRAGKLAAVVKADKDASSCHSYRPI
eukprot:6096124-Prorocentrum_lima.AAC.1